MLTKAVAEEEKSGRQRRASTHAAVTIPMALFYGIMSASLAPLTQEVSALRSDVHALDVRLARLEERIPPRQ